MRWRWYITVGQYTADQIRFVDLVVDHLVENGLIKPAQLFDPPFTDIHAEGVAGVMGEAAEIFIGAVRQINENTLPTAKNAGLLLG